MSARPPVAILMLTLFSFGNLYAPQPLLPLLAANFNVSTADASLLITVTMIPLAVAPLLYGYILEGVPARNMITVAGLILALCHAGIAVADQWWQIVALRSLAGLCLPAVFTALMSSVSATARDDQVRQAVAWYIAATITGGFVGRALSGLLSDLFGWRLVFLFWSTGVFLATLYVLRLGAATQSRFERLRTSVFVEVLAIAGYRAAYATIFCTFFIFAGFLNVLPFRLQSLSESLSSTAVGLAYAGYLVGIVVTLCGQRITSLIDSERLFFVISLLLYGTGIACYTVETAAAIYLGMFPFCAGMFLLHSRLSGHVNELSRRNHGVVNGLYIASYYMGGAIGSWVAPEVYRIWGWTAQLSLLAAALCGAAVGLYFMFRRTAPE